MQQFLRQACFGAASAGGSRPVRLTQQIMFVVQDCAEEQLQHPH
jgi:hypothetical protein